MFLLSEEGVCLVLFHKIKQGHMGSLMKSEATMVFHRKLIKNQNQHYIYRLLYS